MFIYDSLNHNWRAFDDDDVFEMGHYSSLITHIWKSKPAKILQAPNFRKMWHVLGVRRQATAKWNAETGEMSCKREEFEKFAQDVSKKWDP